jgi:hypothetical protein
MGFTKGARFFTEESRQRGQAVHKAVQLIERHCPAAEDMDDVDEVMNIHPFIVPYVKQYLMFKREHGFKATLIEEAVFSILIRTAGRLDFYGTYANGKRVLVDLKSWKASASRPTRSSELQTAFYAMAGKEWLGIETDHRVVLKLPGGDGKYMAYQCTDKTDEHMVYCAAKVWWDQQTHKLLDPNESPEEED